MPGEPLGNCRRGGDDSGHATVHGYVHGRLAFSRQAFARGSQGIEGEAVFLHELEIACQHPSAVDRRFYAATGQRRELRRIG